MKHTIAASVTAILVLVSPTLASPALASAAPASPALASRTSPLPQATHSQSYGGAQSSSEGAQWTKGTKVPQKYQKSQYAVSDWQHRNLATPPKGSRWVRNDNNQYALTNSAGVIAALVGQSAYPDTHRWSRGERVPSAYRNGAYVVSDWQTHHLKRPGRGQHWVHVNNQYMLIAITTGLISRLISDGQ